MTPGKKKYPKDFGNEECEPAIPRRKLLKRKSLSQWDIEDEGPGEEEPEGELEAVEEITEDELHAEIKALKLKKARKRKL